MESILSICMEMRAQIATILQQQINLGEKITKQEEAIETLGELSVCAKETSMALGNIKKRLDKIETKFEAIEERPLKHIQNVTSQIISLIVAGAFGGITAKLFH